MAAVPQGNAFTNNELSAKIERQFQVEQFYYDEAALLDGRRYSAWLELFTDDTHYWMPVRQTRTSHEMDREFSPKGAMAFFDDDKAMLETRVKKLEFGVARPEEPPSRTRHLVTNVRVIEDDGESLVVESNFYHYRCQLNSEEDNWIGMRRDTLRRINGTFRVASRDIYLEQTVVLSRNLSSLF